MPQPDDAVTRLNVRSRTVAAIEALEADDHGYAHAILEDLAVELADDEASREKRTVTRVSSCGVVHTSRERQAPPGHAVKRRVDSGPNPRLAAPRSTAPVSGPEYTLRGRPKKGEAA